MVKSGVFLDSLVMHTMIMVQTNSVLGHLVYMDSQLNLAAASALVMRMVDVAIKHVTVLIKYLMLVDLVMLLVVEIIMDVVMLVEWEWYVFPTYK